MAPSDPIRVTRAVRRCLCWCHCETTPGEGVCHCSDGWVDVPVDEECPTCAPTLRPGRVWASEYLDSERVRLGNAWIDCPDCDGSGRQLHDWATELHPHDEVMLTHPDARWEKPPILGRITGWSADEGWFVKFPYPWEDFYHTADLALVLSDPSHRPEPMRWSTP